MEQMCTGMYCFLGPVFVMVEWESFPCLPTQNSRKPRLLNALLEPLGPAHAWVWRVVWKACVSVQSLESLASSTSSPA